MNFLVYARRVGTTIGIVAATAAMISTGPATAAPNTPTPASQVTYVNLGDSYSAGSGVMPITPGSPLQCLRSERNYAHLIARQFGYRFTDASCGSATTDDFFTPQYQGLRPQLDALRHDANLVTLMIGGNDGSIFSGTVEKCAAAAVRTAGHGSPCKNTYGDSIVREIRTKTFPKLVATMKAVRAKAPNARVAVVSYPWIMPDRYEPCPAFPVAAGDIRYTHDIQAALNDSLKQAAEKTGVTYIDATTPSVGHDSCKPVGVRWIEPVLTSQQIVPVHPNALGEKEIAAITVRALGLR